MTILIAAHAALPVVT